MPPTPPRSKPPKGRGRPPFKNQKPRARSADGDKPEPEPIIYGLHAVEAALRNDRRTIHALHLTENAERRLGTALEGRTIPITRATPRTLDRRLGADTVHQGALAEVDPLPEIKLEEVLKRGDRRPLVILDQVTDPHNVGAVLRSAAAFGAGGLVMTRRHSPPLGATLAKAASGALELVDVVIVQNLGEALGEIGAAGFRRIGFDGTGETGLSGADLSGDLALVFGAEGKGLRQRSMELCDLICRIETPGVLASLNVSNAAAVALHMASLRRA